MLLRLALAAGLVLAGAAPAAFAQEPFRIFIILWRGCEEACQGFQDYFAERRIPVEFVVRDAERDRTRLAGFAREAERLGVDLVVTWGTNVTQELLGTYDAVDPARHITDIPAVFMVVTDPVGAKIVPSLEGSGRNVAGTTLIVPEEVQMRAIQSYRPFERLGVIYNTDEPNAVVSVETLRPVARAMGFELVELTVPLGEDGKPIAAALPGLVAEMAERDVDFLYIGSSSFLVFNAEAFTEAAIAHGIPVAAAGEVPVTQAGALLGLVSRYYNVGKLTAYQAEQILVEGRDPGSLPVEGLERFSLIVNMDVARRLELYPPMNVLRFAEVINGTPR